MVRIDNDSDISALIHEYPFQYPSGKKKGREVHHVFGPPMWEIKVNRWQCELYIFGIDKNNTLVSLNSHFIMLSVQFFSLSSTKALVKEDI